jgi:RNA polymerase sigma factor (sigma-70 family)
MDTDAGTMPVPDRLRRRSRDATSGAGNPPVPLADEVLARRVADGDAAALAALYSRHRVALFGFLERYVGDRMLAEEILQDTLLAVWRSARAYAGRSSVRTWLFGIARRQAHNRLRARSPEQVPLDRVAGWADPAPGPAEWALAAAHREVIAEALDQLALQYREVLALAFAARITHREIAEILGVPVGTVKSRLHHARAALARVLADRGYAEELP